MGRFVTLDINILFIADIVGKGGFEKTNAHLADLKREHDIHLTIANGENGASGKGLTTQVANSFFEIGIDVITSGNHIWNKDRFFQTLDEHPRILRPLNYPPDCPGHGSCTLDLDQDIRAAVINLQGRSFMYNIDCPFRTADREIQRLHGKGIRTIIIDFHAEATAEKIALGRYLDGKVAAVIGTHTHVQTADEQIFPGGTAYITDAGMTGPHDSVIGMDVDTAIRRFMTQLPVHYKMAYENLRLCGVVITIDGLTGKAKSIHRLQV